MYLDCSAQFKDTFMHKPFELIVQKENKNTGAISINLPLPYSGTMADVIGNYSALFVKSYSPGNLASTSMRGMGAQHTAVLWNGINLQSVMNSNIDLNLLPVFFFDKAMLETGANASTATNGSIAGAIYINNDINGGNRIYGELSAGSFGQKSFAVGNLFSVKNLSLNTRMVVREAANDFKYNNYFLPGKPVESLRNSQFKQSGFMQELQYAINPRHDIYVNYWYLQTSRNLPPAMGIINTFDERQDDFSHKLILVHKMKANARLELENKVALVNEQINYYHDLLSPAFNNANALQTESQLKWEINPLFVLHTSVSHTYQGAETDGYRDGVERNLIALWTRFAYKSKNKRLQLSLGSRQMMTDGKMAPASPDLGLELGLSQNIKLKSNLAAGFRIPSFNDLYWQAGGNENLKPELSKKAETSLEFKTKPFKLSLTAFLHHVNDWILWTPDPASQIWKANNAKSVISNGLELATEAIFKINYAHYLKCFGRYQFVKSYNAQVYSIDSAALGKQLFYTPEHTAFVQFQYAVKRFYLNLGANYTGPVFTTADNDLENRLDGYMIMNASLAYRINIKGHSGELSFKANNLLNTTYQVMLNRPMPLRNYQMTFKFNINYDK